MAQTTDGISSREFKIESSTDGSAWTDRSGFACKITPSGGERDSGKKHTFDGDPPILVRGKIDAKMLAVEFVYTEGGSDFWTAAYTAYMNNTAFYLRWHPKGGQTGEYKFTTTAGIVKNCAEPAGDADSADVVLGRFDLEVASITQAAN